MTNEEIIEGNRIIAEFMGAKFNEEYPTIIYHKVNGHHVGYIVDLKYHTSWDWLMPVVVKIHKLGKMVCINLYDEAGITECVIYNWGFGDPQNRSTEIENVEPIEAVWSAVVEFMKWQKQQQ